MKSPQQIAAAAAEEERMFEELLMHIPIPEDTEVSYKQIYSCSLFTDVSGEIEPYISRNGLYLQTYGGGGEGGYVITPQKVIYSVDRNWGKPFTMKLCYEKIICHNDDADDIRLVEKDVEPKETENEMDLDFLWDCHADKLEKLNELQYELQYEN